MAAGLFRDYAASLDIDLSFQDFEREMAALPGEYAPPVGALFLAVEDDGPVVPDAVVPLGCVAVRPFEDDICEMKRLYVTPAGRGRGVGRALAEASLEAAKTLGYRRMRLDTLPSMNAALGLYASLGFHDIPAYRHNPVSGARYLECLLGAE